MTPYERGFLTKCAEAGLDLETSTLLLTKDAASIKPIMQSIRGAAGRLFGRGRELARNAVGVGRRALKPKQIRFQDLSDSTRSGMLREARYQLEPYGTFSSWRDTSFGYDAPQRLKKRLIDIMRMNGITNPDENSIRLLESAYEAQRPRGEKLRRLAAHIGYKYPNYTPQKSVLLKKYT